jgi:hypothetical protein
VFKVIVLKGMVQNLRLVTAETMAGAKVTPIHMTKTGKFDSSKYHYAFELDGQTVYTYYIETRPLSTKHTIAVAGEYNSTGEFVAIAYKNLTTGFQSDPRGDLRSNRIEMERAIGLTTVGFVGSLWNIIRGVSDPFILAICWFLFVITAGFGLFFVIHHLHGSALMKALNAETTDMR